jgi:hypothetical protein
MGYVFFNSRKPMFEWMQDCCIEWFSKTHVKSPRWWWPCALLTYCLHLEKFPAGDFQDFCFFLLLFSRWDYKTK